MIGLPLVACKYWRGGGVWAGFLFLAQLIVTSVNHGTFEAHAWRDFSRQALSAVEVRSS